MPTATCAPARPAWPFNCEVSNPFKRLRLALETHFSIPTKLGVFSTGPYFHDHSAPSRLRTHPRPRGADQRTPCTGTRSVRRPRRRAHATRRLLKVFNDVPTTCVGHDAVRRRLSSKVQNDALLSGDLATIEKPTSKRSWLYIQIALSHPGSSRPASRSRASAGRFSFPADLGRTSPDSSPITATCARPMKSPLLDDTGKVGRGSRGPSWRSVRQCRSGK